MSVRDFGCRAGAHRGHRTRAPRATLAASPSDEGAATRFAAAESERGLAERRGWPSKEKPLQEVAAAPEKRVTLAGRLNPLCDEADAELRAQACH